MTDISGEVPDRNDGPVLSPSSTEVVTLNDGFPPLEVLRQMIEYETHLRLSDSIQELFDLHRQDDKAVT